MRREGSSPEAKHATGVIVDPRNDEQASRPMPNRFADPSQYTNSPNFSSPGYSEALRFVIICFRDNCYDKSWRGFLVQTQCTQSRSEFHGLSGRVLIAGFDGGNIVSDGGMLLIAARVGDSTEARLTDLGRSMVTSVTKTNVCTCSYSCSCSYSYSCSIAGSRLR